MSEYISYYICKKDKNSGLIYPLGPFDDKGDLKCVLWKSRSYYTDLQELFTPVSKEQISDELIISVYSKCEDINTTKGELGNGDYYSFHYCPIDMLCSIDYIKSGYYLLEDIKKYERSLTKHYEFDGFYDCLSPQLYCHMLASENSSKHIREFDEDCAGTKYRVRHTSDYAYYMYPDYDSKEYEAYILKTVADILLPSYDRKDFDVVVIFDRG